VAVRSFEALLRLLRVHDDRASHSRRWSPNLAAFLIRGLEDVQLHTEPVHPRSPGSALADARAVPLAA
jgi:hypothetical protein